MKNKSVIYVLAVVLFLLVSCAPVYSPYIYDQTADLKTRSLTIMNKATDPYSKHEKAVDQLKSDLESVLQQEKMRKHNQVKVKQWNLLLTTDGYLLNGTFAKWQRDTTMSENFVGLQCKLIGEAFDLIQETEKQRLKN